jgi:predicted TIM-barrel fold metal-dependent hydrolase
MVDSHIHIGQFKNVYYDPLEITDIVISSGMEGLAFSSTTSCKDNVSYREIEKEIARFLSQTPYTPETVRPFFWYIPDYISGGIGIENACNVIPYKGIKIHPYAQHWDFENSAHIGALHSLFDYASRGKLPVLIHTGHSGVDSADRFESFFAEYTNTQFILAHSRPLETAVKMLKRYANVFCDTAFVPESCIQKIGKSGLKDKIIFGSDFPITHYYNQEIDPRKQYAKELSKHDNEIMQQPHNTTGYLCVLNEY